MTSFFCSTRFLLLLFLVSAVPVAFVAWLERAAPAGELYEYRSGGWIRECAKWDDVGRRFVVSFMEGGLGQIPVAGAGGPLEEAVVVRGGGDLGRNSSLGLAIDRPRNRVLVAIADVLGNRYSALAAYDLDTWSRIFLTQLNGPDERAFADDVAVDPAGTAYVTDTRNSRIWRVGVDGDLLGVLDSPHFSKKWYQNLIGLNGIVYHPRGFLLAVDTCSGILFKVVPDGGAGRVTPVRMAGGSLVLGDGMELLSPTELVVAAGYPSGRLVESTDGWETASVVGKFAGPIHRVASAATVKDGKVFLNHLVGLGKKHAIVEAVFHT